jgi:hypothetical protein
VDTDPYDRHISVVVVSPAYATDRIVFAGTLNGGVIKSVDGGQRWTQCAETRGWAIMDLGVSPDFESDHTLYAATFRQGLHRSTDGGQSWAPTSLGMGYFTELAVSPGFARDRTIFAATYDGLFKSEDAGVSWERLAPYIRYEDDRNPRVTYSSDWQSVYAPGASSWHVTSSSTPLATAEFSFVSTRLSWIGNTGPNHGMAEVYVDGELQTIVDLYSPGLKWQQVNYQSDPLSLDYHTVRILVSGNRNPLSGGHTVAIDGFDIAAVTAPGDTHGDMSR